MQIEVMNFWILRLGVVALALSTGTSTTRAQEVVPDDAKASRRSATSVAGPTETGFLLPNGWHLTPAGRHIETNDLVLNMLPLSDGRRALASCDGFNEHYLGVFDLSSGTPVLRSEIPKWARVIEQSGAKAQR